ncbi:hypothetical protein IKN40_06160 [bacterium]|nr:hypothetical protein [bacterium]
MKELSIVEKARAYDEAKLRIRAAYNSNKCTIGFMNEIFPEIKESEDEKIRKELITHCKNIRCVTEEGAEEIVKWIVWLEKIGEHLKFCKTIQIGDRVTRNEDGILVNMSQLDRIAKPRKMQSDLLSYDKFEPKFKNGQWIVWQDKCYKVNYNGCGYELVDQNGLRTSLEYGTIDENAHLWTIQDAKPGDVLISKYGIPFIYNGNLDSFNIGAYCGITTEGMFNVATEKCHWTENVNTHPATKEQHDFLFQKMHEKGYEWNAEKKELKEIIDENQIKKNLQDNSFRRMFEHKSSEWHREDEQNLNACLGYISDEFLRKWLTDIIHVNYDKLA